MWQGQSPCQQGVGLTSKRPMRAAAWRARITSVSTHICWTSVDTFSGSGSSWKEVGTMLWSRMAQMGWMILGLGSGVAGWLCLPGSQARDGAHIPDLLVVSKREVSRAPL